MFLTGMIIGFILLNKKDHVEIRIDFNIKKITL